MVMKSPTWSWHQIRQPHIREYEAGESGANFTLVMRSAISAYNDKCDDKPVGQPDLIK